MTSWSVIFIIIMVFSNITVYFKSIVVLLPNCSIISSHRSFFSIRGGHTWGWGLGWVIEYQEWLRSKFRTSLTGSSWGSSSTASYIKSKGIQFKINSPYIHYTSNAHSKIRSALPLRICCTWRLKNYDRTDSMTSSLLEIIRCVHVESTETLFTPPQSSHFLPATQIEQSDCRILCNPIGTAVGFHRIR